MIWNKIKEGFFSGIRERPGPKYIAYKNVVKLKVITSSQMV